MRPRQLHNVQVTLYRVGQRSRQGSWTLADTRRTARMVACCVWVESRAWIYANSSVPQSMTEYHERVGSDHASVGLYQQQVPSWGTADTCMDPIRSTDLFINAALRAGLTRVGCGVPPWSAVQQIQVSAYPDRYRIAYPRAMALVAQNRSYWWPL